MNDNKVPRKSKFKSQAHSMLFEILLLKGSDQPIPFIKESQPIMLARPPPKTKLFFIFLLSFTHLVKIVVSI